MLKVYYSKNETVHAKAPSHADVTKLRAKIVGVAYESVLAKVVKARAEAGMAGYSS